MNFKKFLEYFKSGKNKNQMMTNVVILALIGVLIIIVSGFFKTTDSLSTNNTGSTAAKQETKSENDDSSYDEYETNMEDKLKSTLEEIQGVGKVDTMIYFDSGEEQVPALNQNKSSSVINETDNSGGKRTTTENSDGDTVVTTKDGDKESPLILKKYKPQITGVCVVAQGADSDVTRLNITNAVMNLFGVAADKVNVYPMKK